MERLPIYTRLNYFEPSQNKKLRTHLFQAFKNGKKKE